MLGSLILYLKGMRTTMFQLSGFYCRGMGLGGLGFRWLRQFSLELKALRAVGLFGLDGLHDCNKLWGPISVVYIYIYIYVCACILYIYTIYIYISDSV